MPLDALCLSGLVHELDQTVTGGKIDKIYQPGRDEILLAVRTPAHGNVRLLLSANPNHPRPQLTQISRENPDTPPMFCMLLRKHLSGARLLAVEQPPLERVVMFTLEALNELGDRVERRLVLEAIGRRSNLILLDESGRILDCMRRVESGLGTGNANQRSLLPGMFYRLPPAQEKLDPAAQSREELEALLSAAPEEAQADKWLLDTFSGLSPLVCRELAFQAGGATDVRLNVLGPAGRPGAAAGRPGGAARPGPGAPPLPHPAQPGRGPLGLHLLPRGPVRSSGGVRHLPLLFGAAGPVL